MEETKKKYMSEQYEKWIKEGIVFVGEYEGKEV